MNLFFPVVCFCISLSRWRCRKMQMILNLCKYYSQLLKKKKSEAAKNTQKVYETKQKFIFYKICVPDGIFYTYYYLHFFFLALTNSMALFARFVSLFLFFFGKRSWTEELNRKHIGKKIIIFCLLYVANTYTISVHINLGISNLRFHLLNSSAIALIGHNDRWKYGGHWYLVLVAFGDKRAIILWLFLGRSMAVGHLSYKRMVIILQSDLELKNNDKKNGRNAKNKPL